MSATIYTVKEVERVRILCVGRFGAGKSSLINRVLGLRSESGDADIERGITSPENDSLVLHGSRGFKPGDTQAFDVVASFIKRRCGKNCPPKDRVHAVWLCMEHPTTGGYTFDPSDEKLLQRADETQTPVMIVLTKYDRIVRKKKAEAVQKYKNMDPKTLDQLIKGEAQKAFDDCVKSLNNARKQKLCCVKVSIYPGHDADISILVDVTGDSIREKSNGDASILWPIAHRASLPVKLDACIFAVMTCHRRDFSGDIPDSRRISLQDFFTKVHQDIVTSWNFKDKSNILSSEQFKKFILLLVQDVEESRNGNQPQSIPSQAINQISNLNANTSAGPVFTLPDSLEKSLLGYLSDNKAQAQRFLMTYAVDLTALLRSLFDIKLKDELTWLDLKRAYDKYDGPGSRQKIHAQICADFKQDQPILDTDRFKCKYVDLVKEAVSHPDGNRREDRSARAKDARVPVSSPTSPTSPPSPPSPPPNSQTSFTRRAKSSIKSLKNTITGQKPQES